MRFKQFLKEDKTFDFDTTVAKIKSECQPFLSSAGTSPLLRGISKMAVRGLTTAIYLEQPRSRPAKDSEPGFNLMFNAGLLPITGEDEVRKSSLFATGQQGQARMYGNVNFIFPIGDFSFICSNEVEDSYEESSSMYRDIATELIKELSIKGFAHEVNYIVSAVFEQLADEMRISAESFSDTTNKKASEQIKQSFVENDGGATSRFSKFEPRVIHRAFLKSTQRVFSDLYSQQMSMQEAIKSKCEIAFYESEGFYMVPLHMIADAVETGKIKTNLKLSNDINGMPIQLYELLLNAIHSH